MHLTTNYCIYSWEANPFHCEPRLVPRSISFLRLGHLVNTFFAIPIKPSSLPTCLFGSHPIPNQSLPLFLFFFFLFEIPQSHPTICTSVSSWPFWPSPQRSAPPPSGSSTAPSSGTAAALTAPVARKIPTRRAPRSGRVLLRRRRSLPLAGGAVTIPTTRSPAITRRRAHRAADPWMCDEPGGGFGSLLGGEKRIDTYAV